MPRTEPAGHENPGLPRRDPAEALGGSELNLSRGHPDPSATGTSGSAFLVAAPRRRAYRRPWKPHWKPTVSPHQCPHSMLHPDRIMPLTWSPLTESNRRPSPYHGVTVRARRCQPHIGPGSQGHCGQPSGLHAGGHEDDMVIITERERVSHRKVATPLPADYGRPSLLLARCVPTCRSPWSVPPAGEQADDHYLGRLEHLVREA